MFRNNKKKCTQILQICVNFQKSWNKMMSNHGLIIENMDLSHIHLAVFIEIWLIHIFTVFLSFYHPVINKYTWRKNFKAIIRTVCKKTLPIAIDLALNAKQQCSTPLHTSSFDGNFNHGYIHEYICYRKICAKKLILHIGWPQHNNIFFSFDSIFQYKEWILMNYSDNAFVSYCFSVNLP